MSRYPVKTGPNAPDAPRSAKTSEVSKKFGNLGGLTITKSSTAPDTPRPADSGGFIRFRHTYQSMTHVNGRTHVKASQTRFENGRLQTEEFEGTLDGETYADAAAEMQRTCLEGMTALFRPFWGMLPGGRSDREGNR